MEQQPTLTLTDPSTGKTLTLPVLKGTDGPPVAPIGNLYREMGYFTYDPGFLATASCRSAVTFIDGEQGVLLYRGYPIEQLAEHSTFLEVAYLLMNGELPTAEQFDEFTDMISHHTIINESLKRFYDGFYHDAHPPPCAWREAPAPIPSPVSPPASRPYGGRPMAAPMKQH